MTEWNIQARGRECEACSKAFADKEHYHTLLFDERHDFRRSDVCQECWDKQFSSARDKKGFVSHWQGVFELPKPRAEVIQKENAETLLRKLMERNDPRYAPACYILAVMLERKRLLKIKEQINRDGPRIFIYEQPGTGDIFTVVDPDLQLNQLEAVQRDVAQLLEHGLPDPASQTPEAASTDPNAQPASVAADASDAAEEADAAESQDETSAPERSSDAAEEKNQP